jgi:SAM-dependent methyltransferase
MHETAMEFGRRFFETYTSGREGLTIVDVGAQDVNGSLREVAPPGAHYIGVDFVAGKGVDLVITDPYALPLTDESADVVVCSSVFEHSEFFWLLFNEVLRVLRPPGLFYLNVPANGEFHRFPVDCWRFYPDSGMALQNWGRRSGYRTVLLESFTGNQRKQYWNDFVAVFVKDEAHVDDYPKRIQRQFGRFTNGLAHGGSDFVRYTRFPEDQQLRLWRRLRRAAWQQTWRAYAALPDGAQQALRRLYRRMRRLPPA